MIVCDKAAAFLKVMSVPNSPSTRSRWICRDPELPSHRESSASQYHCGESNKFVIEALAEVGRGQTFEEQLLTKRAARIPVPVVARASG